MKMMKLEFCAVVLLSSLLVASQIRPGLASPSTAPAFSWSPHLQFPNVDLDGDVNYQIVSPKDLPAYVLSQGGWSNFMCSGKEHQHSVDIALVYIGRELLSSDVSLRKTADPALVNLLKGFYTTSNSSVAFPYVGASDEDRMENLLVSGFKEACGHKSRVGNVVFSESCSLEDGSIQRLPNLHSLNDHLLVRKENRKEGEVDLVVFCSESPQSISENDKPHSESEAISLLISSLEKSGTKYAALYVSDSYWYSSYQTLKRFLAESAPTNGSANGTTCDEVCKLKSSLLEGVFVGIVLLLILISGLCCMAGIDTPTRFEAPQDS